LHPPLVFRRTQEAHPAGVRGGQNERPGDVGMSAVQSDRQDPAERDTEHMWTATVNVDEAGECVDSRHPNRVAMFP
jgi:hypothetical protein